MHSLQQIKRLNDLAVVQKTYTINNKQYQVECDFITDVIKCERDNSLVFKSPLNDYTRFEGNLAEYVSSRVSPVSSRLGV